VVTPQQDFQLSGRFDIHQDASEEVKPTQKQQKMKPQKNKPSVKNPSPAPTDFPSFQPRLTPLEILLKFAAKQANIIEKKSGHNDFTSLNDFVTAAKFLIENQKSFCQQDLFALTRSMDTPAQSLVPFFNLFVDELVTHKRCQKVEGAYDYPMYQLI